MNKREAEEIVKESEDYPRYHGKLNGVNYNQAKGFLECYAQVGWTFITERGEMCGDWKLVEDISG